MDRIWKMSLLIVGIIILDQVTKGAVQQNIPLGGQIPVIPGLFNFSHVHNPGAAFGMGAYGGDTMRLIFFKIVPVFACCWLQEFASLYCLQFGFCRSRRKSY
jgi:signal peptidase II